MDSEESGDEEEEEPDTSTTDTGEDEEPEAEHAKKIEKVLLQSTDLNAFFDQTSTAFWKKGILNDEQKTKKSRTGNGEMSSSFTWGNIPSLTGA